VLGHAHCGGIGALIAKGEDKPVTDTFITHWMTIAEEALHRADSTHPGLAGEARARACERSAVLVSLDNLMTFPWIRDRVEAGTLRLNGWYFDLVEGALQRYDPETQDFVSV
jgi:carbonic anhydrase